MSMQIHCPQCGVRLQIPVDAGGRQARCPACREKFTVPDPRTMLDETVTCWLDLDLVHHDEDREELVEDLREQARAMGLDLSGTGPQPKPDNEAASSQSGAQADRRSASSPDEGKSESPGTSTPPADGAPAKKPAAPPPPSRQPSTLHSHPHEPGSRPPGRGNGDDGGSEVRLRVVGVGAYGVRIGFESKLLDRPAFRASMPMRAMMGYENDPGKLIARPLPWVDKATGHFTNPGELEARYEHRLKPHTRPRDVVEQMVTIDELPPPFNQPMPYYVAADAPPKLTIHCETFATRHGVQCEITVPDLAYALEWVGRVNGVCSEDYEWLERETCKFEAAAWLDIPASVRNRIAVWFDFEGDELFRGYFCDADLSKSDAGLGGLIVTTHRLVWCKFHKRGEARLDEPGRIHTKRDGRFLTLSIETASGKRRKMGRLRDSDARALAEVIGELDTPVQIVGELAALASEAE